MGFARPGRIRAVHVTVPDALARRIQEHVASGQYGSFQSAVDDLLRRGLANLEQSPTPPAPPPPPGHLDPGDDRPIGVDPARDVNWAP